MPEIFRNPFLLYFDGYKYQEIAHLLTEPLGTIKSRFHFARKLLKSQVNALLNSFEFGTDFAGAARPIGTGYLQSSGTNSGNFLAILGALMRSMGLAVMLPVRSRNL